MRNVAVLGIGETKIGKMPERTLRELIVEAGNRAIADAGIEKSRIQAVYMSNFNSSFLCNQSHLGAVASDALGLGTVPTLRFEGACASGSLAFRQAYMAIAAGFYDVVLVGGVEKMTHGQTEFITTGIASAADVDLEVNVGATFPSIFAMMANRYFYEFSPDARDAMALCAVQNHDNAIKNPDAQLKKQITIEQVKAGFPIATPLTVFDCSLVSDGAAFVVLTTREIAQQLSKRRIVEVAGSGHSGDAMTVANKKSLTTAVATVNAAKQAYSMAGITPADVDLAEVHDCFTITQILNIEDLGFFDKGTGWKAVLEGKTALNADITINASGGLKAKGHPIGATGLSQIFEVVTQLRGDAGDRQVSKANIGLNHNIGGSAVTCVVNVFRGM